MIRRMADIRKREGYPNPWQVRYEKTTGGFGYRSFRTRQDAQKFIQGLSGHRDFDQETSIDALVDAWIFAAEQTGLAGRMPVTPRTAENYRRYARGIKAYDWTVSAERLARPDVVKFRSYLIENHTRFIARKILRAFQGVLNHAIETGVVTTNVAQGVTIQQDKRSKPKRIIPTTDQVRSFLDVLDRRCDQSAGAVRKQWIRWRTVFQVMILTGARPGEIFGMSWSQIRPGEIRVTRSADQKGRIGPPKSAAGRRTILIGSALEQILATWREIQPGEDDDLVFRTRTNGVVLQSNFRKNVFNVIMREAGLVDAEGKTLFSPYAFRHYFASKLIDQGMNVKYVSRQMGHEDIQTTLNIYGHLLEDSQDQIRAGLASMSDEILG